MTKRTFRLDQATNVLCDEAGTKFDARTRSWIGATTARGEMVSAVVAATWLQRDSGSPCRVPVGVIGPRDATASQLSVAEAVGRGIAGMGFSILCGGRDGVMAAVGKGARAAGGLTIGLLPETEPSFANPYIDIVIATGIGEARNALIARASLCLVAIGNSFGTLSEVALGRHFGKVVIGLEGAAQVEGVRHVDDVGAAMTMVAELALGDSH